MLKYTLRRILFMIPSVIIITFVTFLILSFSSGSPGSVALGITASQEAIAEYNHAVGYDRPVLIRYAEYMLGLLHGDFGETYSSGVSVMSILLPKFPTTFRLALLAVIVAAVIGIPVGVAAAVKKGTAADTGITIVTMIIASVPTFWLGLLMILLFAYQLGWLPSFGIGSWKNMVMPVLTLALPSAAFLARMVRSTMLEELGSDYVRTARAKGASYPRIVFCHVLRNAMLPVITQLGMSFAGLLGGSVIVEVIFGLPGFGNAILDAINSKETMIVMGATVLLSLLYMLIMLAMDLINALLNPRIRDNMA